MSKFYSRLGVTIASLLIPFLYAGTCQHNVRYLQVKSNQNEALDKPVEKPVVQESRPTIRNTQPPLSTTALLLLVLGTNHVAAMNTTCAASAMGNSLVIPEPTTPQNLYQVHSYDPLWNRVRLPFSRNLQELHSPASPPADLTAFATPTAPAALSSASVSALLAQELFGNLVSLVQLFSLCQMLRTRAQAQGNSHPAEALQKSLKEVAATMCACERDTSLEEETVEWAKKYVQLYDKYLSAAPSQEIQAQDHLHAARALDHLGNLHYKKGDHTKALEHYERSLKIRQSVKDQPHLDVVGSYALISDAYKAQGNTAKAMEYYKKTYSVERYESTERNLNTVFEKDDKRRLYWSMHRYLSGEITADTFSNEVYYSYDLELDDELFTKSEADAFHELDTVAQRFSSFEEDHRKSPGVFYTERELKEKVQQTLEKLKMYDSVIFGKTTPSMCQEGNKDVDPS